MGINDSGAIVGDDENGSYPQQAVMWPDEYTIIPILDRDSRATAVNNSLIVVGGFAVAFLEFHGFLWKDGDWESLYPMQYVSAVNNRVQVIGHNHFRSWLWQGGQFLELQGLHPDAMRVRAAGINDLGIIVGYSEKDGETNFPVIWTDGVIREMPAIRIGRDAGITRINNLGDAIGGCAISPSESQGTIWRHNLVTEIDDLTIGPNARRWNVTARDINDNGQIAADIQMGDLPGYRAARLDPIDTGLTLWGMEPSRPGTRNVIQVNHATPGGRVSLLWGTERGEPTALPQCSGAMIDIVDPRLAATARAGPDGRVLFNLFVPANVEGLYVLQSVDHETCEVSPPAWALLKMEN